jgi:MFS family permease
MTSEGCTSRLCVDLADVAASHAQVMGVLAGFVVAAIAVVLQRRRDPAADDLEQPHDGIPALFVALVALVVAAFLYGTAAGAEASPQRVAAMTLAAGLPAAAAMSGLAFGLLGLLLDSAYRELAVRGGTYVALVVPTATSIYVFVSAADLLRVVVSHGPSERYIAVLIGILGIGVFLFLVLVAAAELSKSGELPRSLSWLHDTLTKRHRSDEAFLGFALLAIVGIGLVYFLMLLYSPAVALSIWVAPILVAAWVAYIVIFILTCTGMQHPVSSSESQADR